MNITKFLIIPIRYSPMYLPPVNGNAQQSHQQQQQQQQMQVNEIKLRKITKQK